jgi:hypothetical protein
MAACTRRFQARRIKLLPASLCHWQLPSSLLIDITETLQVLNRRLALKIKYDT